MPHRLSAKPSVKAALEYDQKVYEQRLPAVKRASKALNIALGVNLRSRNWQNRFGVLCKMPLPPAQTHGRSDKPKVGQKWDEASGGGSGERLEIGEDVERHGGGGGGGGGGSGGGNVETFDRDLNATASEGYGLAVQEADERVVQLQKDEQHDQGRDLGPDDSSDDLLLQPLERYEDRKGSADGSTDERHDIDADEEQSEHPLWHPKDGEPEFYEESYYEDMGECSDSEPSSIGESTILTEDDCPPPPAKKQKFTVDLTSPTRSDPVFPASLTHQEQQIPVIQITDTPSKTSACAHVRLTETVPFLAGLQPLATQLTHVTGPQANRALHESSKARDNRTASLQPDHLVKTQELPNIFLSPIQDQSRFYTQSPLLPPPRCAPSNYHPSISPRHQPQRLVQPYGDMMQPPPSRAYHTAQALKMNASVSPWDSQPTPRIPRGPPPYWSNSLSNKIHMWLRNPTTIHQAIRLEHVELRDRISNTLWLQLSGRDVEAITLIRMALPSVVQRIGQPIKANDWLILEVEYKNSPPMTQSSDNVEDCNTHNNPEGPVYFVLAFPTHAVTSANAVIQVQDAPMPLPPNPQRRSKGSSKEVKPAMRFTEQIFCSAVTLGLKGMIPLFCGNEVDEWMLDGFVQACTAGEAVLVMKSREPLPL